MTPLEEEILDMIGRSGSLTATQAAKRFGITESRARDILRSLRESGRVTAKNTVEARIPKST